MKTQIVQRIKAQKIMAIVRMNKQDQVERVLSDLINLGITVLEITSNTPGFTRELKNARSRYPELLIGAGTVTSVRLAEQALQSGAQFLVTPNTNLSVILKAHEAGTPVLVGALTPTEISLAVEYDADFVKLFPAAALGVDYFKALKGPFNNVNFFAVGGIGLSNAKAWLDAGACGLGIGASLTEGNMQANQQLITEIQYCSFENDER